MARYVYEWKSTEQGRRLFRRPGTGAPTRRTAASAPAEAPAPAEDEPALGSLKKDELIALADEQGVDSSGTKADIIARLTDGD